jgi:hypothetical protein
MNYLARLMCLFFLLSPVYAKQINIYLKMDDPVLSQAVTAFNTYLEEHSIFNKYQIRPFLDDYPLHITLYLAAFTDDNLPMVKKRVAHIAKNWAPIALKTSNIYITKGNYVMLDVDNNQTNGKNPPLQQLSDTIALKLNLFRNSEAKIPDWVQAVPEKRKAFERYGSPNVFFEYSPHFSLMAKAFTDQTQEQQFQTEMTELIAHYSFSEIQTKSYAIGIGYVNNFGQITEEIASYPMQ